MYNYLDSIVWLLIQQHKGQLPVFDIIWMYTFLCLRYKCRKQNQPSTPITELLSFSFCDYKRFRRMN